MYRTMSRRRNWTDGVRMILPNPLTRVELPPSQPPSQSLAAAPAQPATKPGGR